MNCHFCHHSCYLSSYKHLYLIQRLVRVFMFPFLSECLRAGIQFEYIRTSGQCWEIIHPKAWVSLQRCDPTVLFITDAASYHRRSCQAALWLLPHLRLRRVLICLDVVYQAHTHEAGVSVSCSYSSDIRHAQHLFLSALSTSWNNGTSYYGTSHPSLWWVSHCSIGFIISDLILFSHRIHWGAQESISTTACRQVLWQGR